MFDWGGGRMAGFSVGGGGGAGSEQGGNGLLDSKASRFDSAAYDTSSRETVQPFGAGVTVC